MKICPICGNQYPESDFIGGVCKNCACLMTAM